MTLNKIVATQHLAAIQNRDSEHIVSKNLLKIPMDLGSNLKRVLLPSLFHQTLLGNFFILQITL